MQRGRWIEIPRTFDSEYNATKTAKCLRGGYLRVQPRDGDPDIVVRGKRYLKTATPVEVQIGASDGEWVLRVRFVD